MGMGIRITVTAFKDVREARRDDVQVKIWTGTKWTCLCWLPYTPYFAEMCGSKPHAYKTSIEFLPPGTVPFDRLAFEKEMLSIRRAPVAIP